MASQGPITAIEVTYHAGSPESASGETYERFAKLSTPAYLWFKRGAGDGISDIVVLYDSEPTPDGYTKVETDLNKDAKDIPVFLAYKVGDGSPITSVKVVNADEPAGPGYTRIAKDLNRKPNVGKSFLCFFAEGEDGENADHDTGFKKGDLVDVLDNVQKWCIAEVIDVKEDEQVYVHYKGWSDKWNEWVTLKSKRIALYRTHTHGDTGPKTNLTAFKLEGTNLSKFTRMEERLSQILLSPNRSAKDQRWLTTEVHEMVADLLNALVDDSKLIPRVVTFFENNINLVLASLQNDVDVPDAHVISLYRIFDGDHRYRRFYNKYGVSAEEESQDGSFAAKHTTKKQSDPTSVYLIKLINYFGEHGGFKSLLARLSADPEEAKQQEIEVPPCGMKILKLLVKVVEATRPYLVKPFSKEFIPKLKTAVFGRVQTISDEEIKSVDRESISDLVSDMDKLLSLVSSESDQFIEEFNLDLALRFITCPYLEKRIYGVLQIQEILNSVDRRERSHQSSRGYGHQGHYGHQKPVAKYLTSKIVVKWVEQKRLVALLLGSDSHMELIRRTPPILMFLSRNTALSEAHLDSLWNSCIGKHESVVRVVYDAIAELSKALSPAHLDFLFDRIKEIPFSDYNDLALQFVKNFTQNAIKFGVTSRKDEKRWYGLDIFWKLIQDDTPLARDLVKQIEDALSQQLQQPECEALKPEFIDRCIKNLKQHTSVCQSLRICRHLIDSYPESRIHRNDLPQKDVIDQLRKKQKLEKLYYEELVRYREKAKANSAGLHPDEIQKKILVGRETHFMQLSQRIMFIEFLQEKSNMMLTKERIETLWDVFITGAVSPNDKTMLLKYLYNARKADSDKSSIKIFTDEVCEHIYLQYLCSAEKLDAYNLPFEGYHCFEIFFRYVNGQKKNLHRPLTRVAEVIKFPLVGLDAFWDITARVENEKVFNAARSCLISMYIKLDRELDKIPIMADFVNRSIGYIKDFYQTLRSSPDDEGAKRSISRLLDVLDAYLESSEKARKQEYLRPSKLHLTVVLREKGKEQSMVATLQNDNTVGTLRQELAKHFDVAPGLLKLIYRDRVLYPRDWDTTTIQEANICHKIICEKIDPSDPDADPDKTSEEKHGEIYARYILSNEQQYFDLLFEILNLGGELGQQVWKLIETLPRNEKLARTIRQLGTNDEPDWSQLGTEQNILKLLYSLQIVERCVDPPDDYGVADTASWCNNFIGKGGLKYLYGVLMAMEKETLFQDQLPQQCLAILLKLVNRLLSGPYQKSARDAVKSFVDFPHLVKRLIYLVHEASNVTFNPDDADAEDEKEMNSRYNRGGYDGSHEGEMGPMNRESVNYGSSYRSRGHQSGSHYRDGRRVSSEGEAPPPTPSNQGEVVEHSIILFIFCCVEQIELLEILYGFPDLKGVIVQGLLSNPIPHLRAQLSMGLFKICKAFENTRDHKPPRDFFVHELLKCLIEIDTESSNCNEYFELIQRLLKTEGQYAATSEEETLELVSNLVGKIKEHPIIETRVSDNDQVLQGLLNLCTALISQHPHLKERIGSRRSERNPTNLGLVEEVFANCLFKLPSKRTVLPPPKCKSPNSRRAAFGLLEALANTPGNLHDLLQLMIPNHLVTHSRGNKPYEWDFLSTYEEKSRTGYVGIKNLGCICYMNAFFQQVYMQPTLRSTILSIKGNVHTKDGEDIKESIIYQLQYILGYLQESEKQFCSPAGFCHAFKDLDGNPTNVSVQMDANEFLNMLFDRIDTKLKGTERENALSSAMGGVLVNQLICKGCPHRSERDEPFYCMSVPVKNKKSVMESMEAFVEGEMLEGDNAYLCGVCNKKVDTLKRICVKKLPPLLCIHLNRFEFDFDTMQKIKVNDKCEFPVVMDMKPYTKEGLAELEKGPPEASTPQSPSDDGKDTSDGKESPSDDDSHHPDTYYKYKLCGVVVHTGSANGGHYYSFIKERGTGVAGAGDNVLGRWFEFNDTIVREMDPESLGNETFGGEETYNRPMHGQWANVTHEKRRNAYMIFYERMEQGLDEPLDAPERLGFEEAALVAKAAKKIKKKKLSKPVRVAVPRPIYDAIWDENITYWRDKWVFDQDYFEFCLNIVKEHRIDKNDELPPPDSSFEHDLHVSVAQLATRFVFETLARSILKDQYIADWFKLLKNLYSNSVPACLWLLDAMQSETGWSNDMLLECRSNHIRKSVSALLCNVLDKVIPLEQQHPDHPLLMKAPRVVDDAKQEEQAPIPISELFVGGLVDLLGQAYQHCDRFPHFFKVLSHYARGGPKQAHWFVKRGFVAQLCDFFLGDKSPHFVAKIPTDAKHKRKKLRDAFNRLEFTHFLSLLSAIVCSASTKTSAKPGTSPPPTLDSSIRNPPSLNELDQTMLFHHSFLQRLLLEGTNKNRGKYVSDIVCHWCWENSEFSDTIVQHIFEDLEEKDYDEQRPYFRTITALVCLEDSLKAKRTNLVLSSLLGVMKHQKRYYKATEMCIEHLIRIAKSSDACFKWLHEHKTELDWIVEWLSHNDRPPVYPEDSIQLVKARAHDDYYSSNLSRDYGFEPAKKKQYLENIQAGKEIDQIGLEDSEEDMAETTFFAGQKLDVRDKVQKWCPAEVKKVEEDKIYIHYTGWSEKWDEWVYTSSSRIARAGQWTDREDTPKHKVSRTGAGSSRSAGRRYN